MNMWFIVILILFMLLYVGILLPSWFGMDTEVEPERKNNNRSSYSYKWTGPKTDARINKMMAECKALLKGLGVPISDSICPEVMLTGTHRSYGRCCAKGSLKKYNEYDFYIEISGHTLNNTDKSLRNTIIHELLHTVPNGMCHTGEWKKWANRHRSKTSETHCSKSILALITQF